ncbi:MAG TPA: hypothetical protein VG122_05990 [Gemmata sp.]|nr:hypothetical protein [Gemmata sp.]
MLARLSAVVQDVGIVATDILKGIGKDGHSVEGSLFVDASCKSNNGGSEPRVVDGDGAEGVAENVAK